MNIKAIILLLIIISNSIIQYGCDYTVSPGSDINGKVFNYDHFPVAGLKVIVGNQFVYTSTDGSFSLKNISFPYDLIVSDSSFRSSFSIYKDIGENNLSIRFNKWPANAATANVKVQLPKEIFQPEIVCKIIFTDSKYVNAYGSVYEYTPELEFDIQLGNQTPVAGKLIVLTYKINSAKRILSYENYGESSEIQIQNGSSINYSFDLADLSLNPGEREIEYSNNPSSNSYINDFYISFSPYYLFNSSGSQFSELTGTNGIFKIPSGLPGTFNTVFRNYSYNIPGDSHQDFIVNPDSPNQFQMTKPCVILSPEINAENVNNNTLFSFSEGDGNGIYEISLFNNLTSVEYTIVTSKNKFTLEGLEDIGLDFFKSNSFTWFVQKIGPANSMNDYVTNFFNKQNHFSTRSSFSFFTTSP